MIDFFAIALTHGLLALACWRLLSRADLDDENGRENGGENGVNSKALHKPWLKGHRATQTGPKAGTDRNA